MRTVHLRSILCAVILGLTAACGPPPGEITPPRTDITELEAPTGLQAFDTPGDEGKSVTLKWKTSPTENTPEFMIREEVKRRQFKPDLTPEDRARIEEEVKALYREEPRIEYRIYSPEEYHGLEAVLAGMYLGDPEKMEEGWTTGADRERLDYIFSLARLGNDIREHGASDAWDKSIKKEGNGFSGKLDHLYEFLKHHCRPGDDLGGRIQAYALSLIPLARCRADLSGIERFIKPLEEPQEPIRQYENTLGKAVDAMGSTELAARMRELLSRLLEEDRNRLSDSERNEIESRREELKGIVEKYRGNADDLLESLKAELRESFWPPLLANMEKNVSWGLLTSFSSGVNFEKQATGPCEFEESGGDYHFYYVSGLQDGLPYRFRLELVMGGQVVTVRAMDGSGDGIVSAVSRPNWFAPKKLNLLLTVVALTIVILLFIRRAKLNPKMFIRRIAGLKAVDESMNRATEMGRYVYYMVGLGYMSELPTIASVNILQRVARQAAKRDLRIKVPCWDPVVMSVAQDVVRDAYLAEGKSADHVTDDVFFVTNDRFSYAASVDGLLLRDKPSTNFFMGNFAAESLLMTEVGSTIDAVQISGTDQPSQLPFFVTTTDYTLIGEELYAASAYLSRDSLLLGSLRGQDVGKIVLAMASLAGAVLTTFGIDVIWKFFS